MRKQSAMTLFAWWAFCAVGLITSAAWGKGAPPTAPNQRAPLTASDLDSLQGDWQVVDVQSMEEPRTFSGQDYAEAEIAFRQAGCRSATQQISLTVGQDVHTVNVILYGKSSPKQIDMDVKLSPYYRQNYRTEGIFCLHGDKLKIGFRTSEAGRPLAGKPNGKNEPTKLIVIELQRVQAKK